MKTNTHLSTMQRLMLLGSLKLSNTFFKNPSSSLWLKGTWTTFLLNILKLGEPRYPLLFSSLISNNWTQESSRNLRKAVRADTYLYFCKYSSAKGRIMSQMKVTPATKYGYLLKKSSIETRIDSRLILVETCSDESAISDAKEEDEGR